MSGIQHERNNCTVTFGTNLVQLPYGSMSGRRDFYGKYRPALDRSAYLESESRSSTAVNGKVIVLPEHVDVSEADFR